MEDQRPVREITHWDHRFLKLAEHVATWSKDPSTKVGAVIADGNRVVSLGYNGFPVGVEDTDERLQDRDVKYKLTVHGERNAILFAERPNLFGCTLYTVPFMPCATCAGIIIQSGLMEVVAPWSDNPRWTEEFKLALEMFEEAGIDIILVGKPE